MDNDQDVLAATATNANAATSSGKFQKSSPTQEGGLGPLALKGFKERAMLVSGVVVIANADPTTTAMMLAAIAHSIVSDGTIADAPVLPVSSVVVPYPQGSREVESMKAYASADLAAHKTQFVALENCRRLNPFTSEGAHIVMGRLKPGTCVLLHVDYNCLSRVDTIASLTALHAEATKVGSIVVISILRATKQDTTWLREYCGVYIEAFTCQPGPGAHVAVALINTSLAGWHALGIGRVMVEASLGVDGSWTYTAAPYISERAAMRLAWYLRAKGCAITDIARVIGIHKSNISRGLDALLISPQNSIGLAPPEGCAKRWATQYKLDDVWPRKSKSSASSPIQPKAHAMTPAARNADDEAQTQERPIGNKAGDQT